MDYSAISVRYSKALFSLASDKNLLDEVNNDFAFIKSVYEKEPEFVRMLYFPVIPSSKKIEIFSQLFSGKVNQLTLEFLNMLSKKRREAFLHPIILFFQKLYKEKKGIKSITFTSVNEISDNVRKSIRSLLKDRFGNNIEIIEQTNSEIVGGFILRIDDEQYDASAVKQLENIKRSFRV